MVSKLKTQSSDLTIDDVVICLNVYNTSSDDLAIVVLRQLRNQSDDVAMDLSAKQAEDLI